jgi:hypothetical protein
MNGRIERNNYAYSPLHHSCDCSECQWAAGELDRQSKQQRLTLRGFCEGLAAWIAFGWFVSVLIREGQVSGWELAGLGVLVLGVLVAIPTRREQGES